jgi:hypothetical protein
VPSHEQLGLIDNLFETARPANPLFCHQEFLLKLADHERDSIGRRASFLMQRLSVDARRIHYKATQGVNRGWRRSRLGGGSGSHFYAWWAPRNAAPLKESGEFPEVPEGSIFLRDIRHHDDHSLLAAQSFEADYMPLTVRDLRREVYAPLPWTPPQVKFASARQSIRLLKGHPGSGKTTALWNAADAAGVERVLYITYSRDLALLAREYFDRFCSNHKQFHVVTFPAFIRQLLGTEAPLVAEREGVKRFCRDVAPFVRNIGAWANNPIALYDELHAHLVGDALPVAIGRFAPSSGPRVPDQAYRERRARSLGASPVASALDTASRLERLDTASLAERYFPELALAWRAVERLRNEAAQPPIDAALLSFDAIAVDECQDLTPIEALSIVELAGLINRRRRSPVPLLIAGDEAQTVRPTDFEWGWLSDLLHTRIGTPSEFKLSSNLRSPKRIAELVNRVWDLYSHINKQDRPSGVGYAEIDDDATDQILYCTAVPGPELDALLTGLSVREGLALISLEETVPAYVPESARAAVLTVSEAKGLDFHSVCVMDAGRHIGRIVHDDGRVRAGADVEELRKRLAIDQLRVALSRPTERLFWLDINPSEDVVRHSTAFLNGADDQNRIASSVPAALLKMLDEEELDVEERIQRCQSDARQFLQIKPEMAWSRAQQAVNLLGRPGSLAAVADEAARRAAFLTLAEVCSILALRNTRLAPELGRVDLFVEAQHAAVNANRHGLAAVLQSIARVTRATQENRLGLLAELAHVLPRNKAEIEPWLLLELSTRSNGWVEELETALVSGRNAAILIQVLPPFYEALDMPDRGARTQRLRQRAITVLIKEKQYGQALGALKAFPERQLKLEAACHEGLGDFRSAAECHLADGNPKEAFNCYRSVPDLEAALNLLGQIGEHPAAESLQWVSRLQKLVAERPEKFTKLSTPAERKMLEEMLERALGVSRRKPAPRKMAAGPKKAAAKKAQTKPAAAKKTAPPARKYGPPWRGAEEPF